MQLIQVEQISFAYGGNPILKSISFELAAGQILAIVGESGEGKSTLLQILAGFLEAQAGAVYLNKEKLQGPAKKLIAGHDEVKLVAQDYKLNPNFTVFENIAYPIRHYTKAYQEERVATLMVLFRIEALAHKLPKAISGGEKQRTALAKALADIPKVLLLDEPFSNLDNINKKIAKKAISQIIEKEQVACIFVSHDLHDVRQFAQEVAFLKNAEFIEKIPVKSLDDYKGNPYVQEFIEAL